MNMIKNLKCLICLVRCSKYLYFAKKVVCFMTIVVMAAVLLCLAYDKEEAVRRLKGMM